MAPLFVRTEKETFGLASAEPSLLELCRVPKGCACKRKTVTRLLNHGANIYVFFRGSSWTPVGVYVDFSIVSSGVRLQGGGCDYLLANDCTNGFASELKYFYL